MWLCAVVLAMPKMPSGSPPSSKALHSAVLAGGVSKAVAMLEQGADPNGYADADGFTPLFAAVMLGDRALPLVERLLVAGADPAVVAVVEGVASSVVLASVPKGSVPLTRALIEGGAAPGEVAGIDFTPLQVASFVGAFEMVELLLQYPDRCSIDAKVLKAGEQEVIPAALAGNSALGIAVSEGNEPIVSALLAAGANPNGPEEASFPPLVLAAMQRRPEIASWLLKAGADTDRKTNIPPADIAADPQLRNANGATALHAAAHIDAADIVRDLLVHGADPFIRQRDGRTPAEACEYTQADEAFAVFKSHAQASDTRAWRSARGLGIRDFLAKHKLSGYADAIMALGAESPADLLELDDEDWGGLNMKKIHRSKYLRNALDELRGNPPGRIKVPDRRSTTYEEL